MMNSKELKQRIWNYLESSKEVHDYSTLFKRKRAEGLLLLFDLKSNFQSISEMTRAFYEIKNFINDTRQISTFQEDLLDELEAILIANYPMPDFWTSSIEDFKHHKGFMDDFDALNK